MKKLVEKIEDKLSVFFSKNIKLKDTNSHSKQVFINNNPVQYFISFEILKTLDLNNKQGFDQFIIETLTDLKDLN